jgi:RNA polymerase sigma factor (sigma-70 family)
MCSVMTDTIISDQELLAAFAGGEQDALSALVHRHAKLVYASCRRQLPPADADDATQAVFLVLTRKPSEAAKSPSLEAWLLRVARNVTSNLRRSQARRARAEQRAVAMLQNSQSANDNAALSHLDEVLDILPEHERQVIVLHVMSGIDHDELAARLRCPKGTVRARLSRGLGRMREALQRRGVVVSVAAVATVLAQNAYAEVPARLLTAIENRFGSMDSADGSLDHLVEFTIRANRCLRPILIGSIAITCAMLLWAWSMTRDDVDKGGAQRERATKAAQQPLPDSSVYVPADSDFMMRINDWQRTVKRFADTPYAEYIESGAGENLMTWVVDEWRKDRDTPALPRDFQLRNVIVAGRSTVPRLEFVKTLGNAAKAFDLLHYSLVVNAAGVDDESFGKLEEVRVDEPMHGRIVRDRDLIVLTNMPRGRGELPVAAKPLGRIDATADFEMMFRDGWRWGGLQSSGRSHMKSAVTPPGHVTAIIGKNGLRYERFSALAADEEIAWSVKPINRRLVDSLPHDTLAIWLRSCTDYTIDVKNWSDSMDMKAFAPATGEGAAGSVLKAIYAGMSAIAHAGLPERVTLNGDLLIYIRASSPLPSLTISAGMDSVQASLIIDALVNAFGGKRDANGLCTIGSSLFPVQAQWLDGNIVITTHFDGIAGHVQRSVGFTQHDDVQAALARIPHEAYAACVVRGGEAWGTIAQYAASFGMFLSIPADKADRTGAQLVMQAIADMPVDIRRLSEGRYEMMYNIAGPQGKTAVFDGMVIGMLGWMIDIGAGAVPWQTVLN